MKNLKITEIKIKVELKKNTYDKSTNQIYSMKTENIKNE